MLALYLRDWTVWAAMVLQNQRAGHGKEEVSEEHLVKILVHLPPILLIFTVKTSPDSLHWEMSQGLLHPCQKRCDIYPCFQCIVEGVMFRCLTIFVWSAFSCWKCIFSDAIGSPSSNLCLYQSEWVSDSWFQISHCHQPLLAIFLLHLPILL